jgi:hypothetical protein
MQLYLVVIAKIIFISTHKGYYLRKIKNRACSSFVTGPYFYAYIRGVDYKGLNGSVTSVIYHMAQNIECICR